MTCITTIDQMFSTPIVTFEDAHCVCLTRSHDTSGVTQYGVAWKAKPEAGTFWYNDQARRDAYRHAFA